MPAKNLADDIFHDMQRRILSGALASGERLPPERDLAASYATNRNTLREAIRKLEQSRLVSVRQGQGITVSDFRRTGTIDLLAPFLEHGGDDAERMRVLSDVLPSRIRLIEETISFAASRATAADHARLEGLVADQLGHFARSDARSLERAHHRWLDALVDAAHSLPLRWVGNSLLAASEALFDRFPDMWLLEPSFPAYQRGAMKALLTRDAGRGIVVARTYHRRIDRALQRLLGGLLQAASPGGEAPAPGARKARDARSDTGKRRVKRSVKSRDRRPS